MTMRITMIQARLGESGSVLAAGSTYTVSDLFGRTMVYNKFATDTDNAMLEPQRFTEPGIAATQALVSGAGSSLLTNRSRSRPCALIPTMPISVSTAFTGTHSLMMTAPGEFDAVAVVACNIDASTMIIDAASVAVSERSDTSKTVPTIGGTTYNQAAPAGTQNGFIAVTWGGSASVTVAAGTATAPTWAVSDFTAISSIPRVDDSTKFPLVLVREYFNARTLSTMTFGSGADVDTFSTLLAPHEFYQTAQATVDGATPATAANYTATWAAGTNTQTMRIFGLLFRIRGTSDTVLIAGDSILRGSFGANGGTLQSPGNMVGGWFTKSILALSSKTAPIGFVNLGISGDTSTSYLARTKAAMTALRPNVCGYAPYTTNDTPTNVLVITQQLSRALDFVDTCQTNRVAPILLQATPVNRTLALRLDSNAKVAAMSPLVASLDLNTPIYDPANAGNNYFLAGTNQDDTHPNSTGHNLLAASATTQLRTLLGR
ncbi:MAG: hypothetical protein QE285_07515 [Aquabacterium sp.]|nr:hypothetical protein [Aquabacterium sp.]